MLKMFKKLSISIFLACSISESLRFCEAPNDLSYYCEYTDNSSEVWEKLGCFSVTLDPAQSSLPFPSYPLPLLSPLYPSA